MVNVDPVNVHAQRGEAVTLSGQVLVIGGASGVPDLGQPKEGATTPDQWPRECECPAVSPHPFRVPVVLSRLTVDTWLTFARGTKVPSLPRDAMRTLVRR